MKQKILFIIPRLSIGGAQKVLSIILNNLDRQKFELILCLFDGGGEYVAELSADIKVINIHCKRVSQSFFKLIGVIKKNQPSVIFSALSHLNIVVALCIPFVSKSIKFFARETNIPSINNQQNRFSWLFNCLHRWLYPRYTKIVCQSNDMKIDLIENFKIPESRLLVINNPIEISKNNILAQSSRQLFDTRKINLVAAGKLKYQKGFDLLLQALAKLNDDSFFLTLLGKGELEKQLQAQARNLHIAHQIHFAGQVENPLPYMRQADFFILSSRFEGFPNVVLEALSVGTPVIAFDCKGGISDIITDGVNGLLINPNDVEAMASAIKSRQLFNKNEIIKSVADMDISIIKEKFEQMFAY